MQIREAFISDMSAILEIYALEVLHGTATAETEVPLLEEMEARFKKVKTAGFPYFVMEDKGSILGYAYAGAYHTRAGYKTTVEDSIYVAREAQGKGVGKALLEALIDDVSNKNYLQMMAVIGGFQNKASISLHEKCEFILVGHAKNLYWKKNQWVDLILMQRQLGEGAKGVPKI